MGNGIARFSRIGEGGEEELILGSERKGRNESFSTRQ